MIKKYIEILKTIGHNMNLSNQASLAIAEGLATLSLLVLSILLIFLTKFIITHFIYKTITKTKTKADDLLIKNRVLIRICLLIPAILIKTYATDVLHHFVGAQNTLLKLNTIYEIIIFVLIIISVINTISDYYESLQYSKAKPIKGLVQFIKIFIYIICFLLIVAFLLHTKVSKILIGLGTISAVLMLVFQDTIKGFVGGIQLSVNDMLRIGDWIVMGNADGNVLEINLTTVKVQNWDNTITTIPTYSLVSNPFTNWRGMSESGGRRISRSINIDINTIRFCTPEMMEKFKHYSLISDYVAEREEEILEYNKANRIDTSCIINGRQQTNLGIYRAYLMAYLKNNPKLNHNMTMMVRQLQPTEFGVPIQIYTFSSIKDWESYEKIQSDLFDHILAATEMFDLKLYQRP